MNKTFPHTPAAFINSIRDEGTKEEACNYLQETWNELVALRLAARPLHEQHLRTGPLAEATGSSTVSVDAAALADLSKAYMGEV